MHSVAWLGVTMYIFVWIADDGYVRMRRGISENYLEHQGYFSPLHAVFEILLSIPNFNAQHIRKTAR